MSADTGGPNGRHIGASKEGDGREMREEEIVLSMGPQHPSTHGVLRLILRVAGEEVLSVEPEIGYLHRGFEKLGEASSYIGYTPIVDRQDYLTSASNEFAFCLAAERIAGIEVPKRAQYLRVIAAELNRIASHLVWLGTWCLDLGGALGGGTTIYMYCFRERERILDLLEEWTGARLLYGILQPGGIRYDLPRGFHEKAKESLELVLSRIDEYHDFLSGNPVFVERTRGVGVASAELCKALGLSGPIIRGAGIPFDVRKAMPYSSYEDFDFTIPTGKDGDCYDRYVVRMEEMRQAIRITMQALEGLPEGPINPRPHYRSPVAFRPPKGEAISCVESPRGMICAYIVSDGTERPYRVRWRTPSFAAVQAMRYIAPGHKVADMVSILGSLDPVLGDVDR
jgi:NADH-quinone oxidoreductase subunit D